MRQYNFNLMNETAVPFRGSREQQDYQLMQQWLATIQNQRGELLATRRTAARARRLAVLSRDEQAVRQMLCDAEAAMLAWAAETLRRHPTLLERHPPYRLLASEHIPPERWAEAVALAAGLRLAPEDAVEQLQRGAG